MDDFSLHMSFALSGNGSHDFRPVRSRCHHDRRSTHISTAASAARTKLVLRIIAPPATVPKKFLRFIKFYTSFVPADFRLDTMSFFDSGFTLPLLGLVKLTLEILAIFVVAGALIPLIRCDHWTIRGWDFPRIQLFILGLIVLPLLIWTGGEIWIAYLLSASLTTFAIWIWRYTPLHRKEVLDGKGKTGIRFLVSNVLMTNRESEKLIALVRKMKPDFFIALETDQWWTDSLAVLADEYPHAIELPQEDTFGMVVRSRMPLINVSVEYIIRKNIPSVHADLRLENGTLIHLHAVHPKPPFPDEDETSTDRDAELLTVGKRVELRGGPTIVLGDLNDVAWSRTTRLFQKTSSLLDPRVGRGFFCTFHAGHWFLRWPLDHIFISDHFRVRDLERLHNVGSDHFPMFADFSFEPDGKHGQDAPEKDQGDDEEAEEKIAAAKSR